MQHPVWGIREVAQPGCGKPAGLSSRHATQPDPSAPARAFGRAAARSAGARSQPGSAGDRGRVLGCVPHPRATATRTHLAQDLDLLLQFGDDQARVGDQAASTIRPTVTSSR